METDDVREQRHNREELQEQKTLRDEGVHIALCSHVEIVKEVLLDINLSGTKREVEADTDREVRCTAKTVCDGEVASVVFRVPCIAQNGQRSIVDEV